MRDGGTSHFNVTKLQNGLKRFVLRNASCSSCASWWKLFHHRAERQDDFAENFVQHLREACVDRRKSAENAFVAGEMLKVRTRADEITDGEKKEENSERTENDLASDV